MNIKTAITDTKNSENFIGKDETSWKFLNNMANISFSNKEKNFGYFLYTPDVIGYGPRYALNYQKKLHKDVIANYLEKEHVTLVIVAPQAKDNPFITYKWWKENTINLKNNPNSVITFPNGYTIEKYYLDKDSISVPFNKNFDPGLGFR